MADNVTVDTITGSPVVASDDIAGAQYQRIKLVLGANGVNDGDVSSANPVPISDAGGAITVDGTVAATQSGSWDVGTVSTITNVVHVDDNASTISVDDGGGTLTVDGTVGVSGSVAVTNAGITTIAGAVSGTEMQVDVLTMPTTAVTGTFWQATQPVSIASAVPITDNSGSLTVDAPVATPVFVRLSDGSSAISTLPVSLASVPSHAVTNAGTFATQVTSISAGDNNIGNVDIVTLPSIPAGTNNIGDVDVLTLPSLPAGTNAIGKLAANSGVDIGDVDVTSISAGSNLIGDVGLQGRTTGGLSIFRSIDLDESEEEAKGSAGTLYSIDAMNMTSSVLYLKIYDGTAASVTVGTTTPVLTYVLPTNGDSNGCGMVKNIPQGLAFANGITVAVTTGLADNSTGAPAANAAIINLGYK